MHKSDECWGFHESYYAHNCAIIPEKDVIYTDIRGRGVFATVRRWWNDLFLLSTTNKCSRGFYNSSHAMRVERFKQFRKYRSRIHPMSKFINFWNTIILLAFIVNKILFRFTSSMVLDKMSIYYYYLGAFLECLIILDLFVNLKTGYIDDKVKRVVLDPEMSVVNYCSNKLFIHFISAIPVHWFMFLKYGSNVHCGLCKFNQFMCAIKIMNVFGLYRVFEMSSYWTKKRISSNMRHVVRFSRIGIVGIVTMLEFYEIVDVIWILTMIHNQMVESSSYIGKLIHVRYGLYKNMPNYMILCFDIARIFKSLLLFSFNVKYSSYSLDKLTSVIAYIIANSFLAWSILECYSLVSCAMYPIDKFMNAKQSVFNLLRSRQLSDEIMFKTEAYFNFNITTSKILEIDNGLYKSLPSGLKIETLLSCYIKLIMRIPLFGGWPLPVLKEVALLLKPEVYLRGDTIAQAWTDGRGLMILDVGVLAVYSIYKKETGHLIDGDFFGELSLFTDKEANMSYVVAVTDCRMLILEKFDFRKFMRQQPQMFHDIRMRIENQYKDDNKEIENTPTLETKGTHRPAMHHSFGNF